MEIYVSDSHDAFYNLSLEETLLKKTSNNLNILFIYRNKNAIVIGRNQNAFEEINHDFARHHHTQITRRISGGGAVFHDLGNINFSFITKKNSKAYKQKKCLIPIISFLNSIGVNAIFQGRNDLVIGNKKISGSAQYIYNKKMIHHGTLLFDSNLDHLQNSLKVKKNKFSSKGIKSIRQRVTNIKEYLKTNITSEEFMLKMRDFFLGDQNKKFIMTKEIESMINEIKVRRSSWEWVYQESPDCKIISEKKWNGGSLKILLRLTKGKIEKIKIQGDFLSSRNIEDVEKKLINVKWDENEIIGALHLFNNFDEYFGTITKREFIKTLFEK